MLRSITDRSTFVALRQAPASRCAAVRVRVVVPPAVPVSQSVAARPPASPPRSAPSADAAAAAADVRVGFALTRRVGGAVVRNRIRRRLRAVMDGLDRGRTTSAPPLVLRPGAAYLLSAGTEAATCPYPTLTGWVEEAVRRSHRRLGAAS